MSDTARHSAPQRDIEGLRHTLSLSEVEAQLSAAGVPRSHRHIQRLCKSGAFDANRVPGPSGDEWRIAPHSVAKVIGDLRAIDEQRVRHGATQIDMTHHVGPENPPNTEADTARHSAPQRDMSGSNSSQERGATQPDTSRYVGLLERENEFLRDQVDKKDVQIADLSKRFGETQALLGATQRMLAPLLGQPDPFNAPEKREVEDHSSPPSP